MAKRQRNTIGQFISPNSVTACQKTMIFQANFWQKGKAIFMVLFLIFVASPWITLAIKSKQIKKWTYLLLQFYSKHFINADEIKLSSCTPTKEDI